MAQARAETLRTTAFMFLKILHERAPGQDKLTSMKGV